MDGNSLRSVHPELYEASLLKGVVVGVMGGWIDGNWVWGDLDIPEAFLMERGLEGKNILLLESLSQYVGPKETMENDDVWWIGSDGADLSVASCYEFYERSLIPFGPYGKHDEAYRHMWKADVPFKIKVFGWRLLLDRLHTKELLVRRGIPFPLEKFCCTLCEYGVENRKHFFFGCRVVKEIWNEIALWVGKVGGVEDECLSNFMD
ncbi:uncharacterized protein LOC131636050 [Vicia villosa]|uniref:uncharacterized protein LOC131636050 n=1 Tax=Vicia villosa TaxID=3911 RepID=UPI00273BA797|nr:uncharacterized protein LOC131636050 [Vicia villosa]